MHVNEPGKSLICFCGGKTCLTSFCSEVAESLLHPQGLVGTRALCLQGESLMQVAQGTPRGLPKPQMPDLLYHLGSWLELGQTGWHIVGARENEFSFFALTF